MGKYIVYMGKFFENNNPVNIIPVFIGTPNDPPGLKNFKFKFELDSKEIGDCLEVYFGHRKNKIKLIISENVESKRLYQTIANFFT